MITKVVPGQLVASKDAASVARDAAARMARLLRNAIKQTGRASLALSGGNTPRDAYAQLAHQVGIDWTKVDIFWVDERAVPPTSDRSNYLLARSTLLDAAGIEAARVHRMPADAPNLETAARDYERVLRQRVTVDADGIPAFDLMVLGVGDDGHTASMFPGEATVDIHDRLVASVPPKAAREARLTLTPPMLEHARNLLILVVGGGKRPAIERVWAAQGDLHATPARVIRGCRGAVMWIIDRAAGGLGD
jgi:6-phosphogluconolactonase